MAENKKNIFSDWENVVYEGRNEIVFADRNKVYGAYVIRKSYNRTVSRAVIISAAILFSY